MVFWQFKRNDSAACIILFVKNKQSQHDQSSQHDRSRQRCFPNNTKQRELTAKKLENASRPVYGPMETFSAKRCKICHTTVKFCYCYVSVVVFRR